MHKFNTEGPVVADRHYCIPPPDRVDLDEVLGLIRDERYFVLHAPRRTGKTSTLLALRDLLNGGAEYAVQATLNQDAAWYVGADGALDMDKLLAAFQTFFREHSEHWVERFDCREAGPQLLLQAFLQRIVNGGGRIEREYGLGRGRTDLLVVWPRGAGRPQDVADRIVIECKVLHGSLERTVAEGLVQTAAYADRCAARNGHLVVFDRSEGRAWEEKIFRRKEDVDGRTIAVWGT